MAAAGTAAGTAAETAAGTINEDDLMRTTTSTSEGGIVVARDLSVIGLLIRRPPRGIGTEDEILVGHLLLANAASARTEAGRDLHRPGHCRAVTVNVRPGPAAEAHAHAHGPRAQDDNGRITMNGGCLQLTSGGAPLLDTAITRSLMAIAQRPTGMAGMARHPTARIRMAVLVTALAIPTMTL